MQDISNQTGSANNSTSNQNPILNASGIPQDQDTSNQVELSFYRSAINLTSNESQIQEHSNVDHPQLNDPPESVNQSGNLEELQPHNNFTVDQQQNHSGKIGYLFIFILRIFKLNSECFIIDWETAA